jgi:hypothetical protein
MIYFITAIIFQYFILAYPFKKFVRKYIVCDDELDTKRNQHDALVLYLFPLIGLFIASLIIFLIFFIKITKRKFNNYISN